MHAEYGVEEGGLAGMLVVLGPAMAESGAGVLVELTQDPEEGR